MAEHRRDVDRLQPALLDRLMDDEPRNPRHSRESWVLTLSQLRELVLRDLTWLLNAGNFTAVDRLDEYSNVEKSVINFGLPSLAGLSIEGGSALKLERAVKQAILNFEPRIFGPTLQVRTVTDEQRPHALVFEIQGELWAWARKDPLFLRTEVDLETGRATIATGGKTLGGG